MKQTIIRLLCANEAIFLSSVSLLLGNNGTPLRPQSTSFISYWWLYFEGFCPKSNRRVTENEDRGTEKVTENEGGVTEKVTENGDSVTEKLAENSDRLVEKAIENGDKLTKTELAESIGHQ